MSKYSVHTSLLFDPVAKRVRQNISVTVDATTGLIVRVFERDDDTEEFSKIIQDGDIDLRGRFVMPGLVDAHTHIFLHSYE